MNIMTAISVSQTAVRLAETVWCGILACTTHHVGVSYHHCHHHDLHTDWTDSGQLRCCQACVRACLCASV